jgi:HlyD family secretion protein
MKRFVIIGIPVAIFGGLLIWRYGIKRATAAQLAATVKARGTAPANVVLAKAVSRDVDQKLLIVGDAESPYNIGISPKVTGVITMLNLREGDQVRAGQVVAQVDTEEISGQVAQDEATLAADQQRYTQAKITEVPTDVTVKTTIDQQHANVASNIAEYNQSRANYAALAAGADATVTDAKAKTASAESQVQSAQASVQSAQANLNLAQATYNRDYTLYKQAYIAAQDVDTARTTYEVQKQAVNVANKAFAAAKSALDSAKAEQADAQYTASITKLKGVADVQAAKALLTQAQATLRSAVSNKAQIPAYLANLNALKAQTVADQGLLSQAKARLLWTNLITPIDGIITARNTDPGATANPGVAVLQVQFLKWLYVEGAIPVEQSSNIHVGMTADIVFDALPKRKFTGKISRVNPSADPTNRQFMVYVQLENPDLVVRPGMYAKISLITSSVHADVVIPNEAIHKGTNAQGDTVTLVDKSDLAHIVPVKEGVSDASGVQILSGVEAGQRVVVQQYVVVMDGQKVSTAAKGKKGANGGASSGGSGAADTAGSATAGTSGAPAGGSRAGGGS